MKIICWNCRGLGNPQIVQDLSLLVKDKWPTLVFVCKTKTKSCKISNLLRKLGMEGCLVVDSDGRRGGEKEGKDWQFTGFYGHPETRKRELSWEMLRQLRPKNGIAWCVGGDFNEILWHNEKVGGKRRPDSQLNLFRNALEDCGLSDIGCRGSDYT
ncbi:hypothetical protein I3760_11G061900 [Carya illinoinensis]|nr:hypothetical protein I3760_11G061900 [Carya illinoinensis]